MLMIDGLKREKIITLLWGLLRQVTNAMRMKRESGWELNDQLQGGCCQVKLADERWEEKSEASWDEDASIVEMALGKLLKGRMA